MISMVEPYVIAIDGPAGSGKSTVARQIADRLGAVHADSGAIYRSFTFALMEIDGGSVAEKVSQIDPLSLNVFVRLQEGRQVQGVGSRVLDQEIRSRAVTENIRYVASAPRFRSRVDEMLRDFARATNLVIDGRDIGTVVFPATPYKFYLDASVEVRAARRLAETREEATLEELVDEVARRDQSDRERAVAPLQQAADAIYIDTSSLDINAVVQRILSHLQVQF